MILYAFIRYDHVLVKIYDGADDWKFTCERKLDNERWFTKHVYTATERESFHYALDKYFSSQGLPLPSYDLIEFV